MTFSNNYRLWLIAAGVFFTAYLHADTGKNIIFKHESMYGENKHAVLEVYKNTFVGKPKWNYINMEEPPYDLAKAVNTAMLWATEEHPEYQWVLSNVSIRFYPAIEYSCVYVISLSSHQENNKRNANLPIGIDMNGKLIEPGIIFKPQ